ncbi:glycosyltransferase family 2 protein [Synechococcus sp. CB0101]|uniref:glycosyltransferase n=1 Tax=Synechococcus sp. CB0101 TaxID=232348 RepID=UPI0002002A61|nr:glycosyltransferase family 2 protein [Synechococcus sp. CB0101]
MTLLLNFPWLPVVLVGLAGAACLGLLILLAGLQRVFAVAPRLLELPADQQPVEQSLTVVVPAYNEATNIEACVSHVLASEMPCSSWQLLVVDDDSSDATGALAAAAAAASGCPPERFRLLQAGPRPGDQRWVGKNWACTQAAEQTQSDWLLFIDADVRLQPDALRRALLQALHDQADLLSLAPRLGCTCLAEWMVQPIMASLLGLGFPIQAANDPSSPVAFAAGPFMLFRRPVYEQIGGHRALAAEVVEDLALARRIKTQGYRLRYLLGLDVAELNMYANFAALWEGWSKNWFLGLDSSVPKALSAAGVVVLMFSGPWLLLGAGLLLSWWMPWQRSWWLVLLLLAGCGVLLQLALRVWSRRQFQVPLHLWWLMGAGGLLVGAIGPTSVWRTLTGRGWTWKGRQLS